MIRENTEVEIGFNWAVHKHINRCLSAAGFKEFHGYVEALKQLARPFMTDKERERYERIWEEHADDDGDIDFTERMSQFGDLMQILWDKGILSRMQIKPEQLRILEEGL